MDGFATDGDGLRERFEAFSRIGGTDAGGVDRPEDAGPEVLGRAVVGRPTSERFYLGARFVDLS
jgi:hypothetical protein